MGIDPESHGLTHLADYQHFIKEWRHAVGETYMGMPSDQLQVSDLVRQVMEGDGGLLVALGMLDRILTSGDTLTAEAAAGDIGIELIKHKFPGPEPYDPWSLLHVISEEP